ncbi:hypothetical protein GUJ93_ZPchr0005g15961 [Zizania palustris]|uniref:Uncharacterized protein n=1 Tax=Zizania palustris TaxID=103762 RepID=A0A8J5S8T8_ZIZPA|nr:hypothetical protein GUJ93_ZPchr0005g15961 [Zizania palustris]
MGAKEISHWHFVEQITCSMLYPGARAVNCDHWRREAPTARFIATKGLLQRSESARDAAAAASRSSAGEVGGEDARLVQLRAEERKEVGEV